MDVIHDTKNKHLFYEMLYLMKCNEVIFLLSCNKEI